MTFLSDPNVAYLLLVLTVFFATLAVLVPGTGGLEVVTLFLALLSGYALLQLPVNLWALALLGVAGLAAAKGLSSPKRGGRWLGLAGLGFLLGSVFLFSLPGRPVGVHPALALTATLLLGLYLWFGLRKGLEAWRQKPKVQDLERLIGQVGEARTAIAPQGTIYVAGETWSARSRVPIPAGQKVRVVERQGLTLIVEPCPPSPASQGEATH